MAKATDMMALATINAQIALAEFNATAANTALLGDGVTAAMIEAARKANDFVVQLHAVRARFEEGMKDPKFGSGSGGGKVGGSGRKSSGGGGGVDQYAQDVEKWDDLVEKLAQLENKSTGAAASLNKTLKEIEETGKAAKKSAGEIESLKQAFIEASDTKAMRELNKELLQLEGNTRAVRDIENQEKTEQFSAKLSEIKKLSQGEKDILLGRYQTAVQNATDKENIETRLNFYKELAELSGNYSLSIEYQNRLIDEPAKEWIASGISVDDVKQRVELMKSEIARDPFSGMMRGLKSYANEATDLASQLEDSMGNAFQGIEDAFVSFVQTGKMSFSDLANSIISDLMRIAIRATITGPIANALGGLFGSFFGGGTFNGLTNSAATGAANTSGYNLNMGTRWSGMSVKGNVFLGGSITSFSNRVVKGPTLFDYNKQITAFANGAGLMGEAGAEAILPLKRNRNGDLGVHMTYDAINGGSATAEFARIIAELNSQILEDRQYSGNMPIVNVNIENNSNAQVQAGQMQPDGSGGFSMDVIISQVEQGIVDRMK